MSGKRNSLILLSLVVSVWSIGTSVAEASYTNLSFQGTIRVVALDNGGIFTGTQVGDAFFGSFLYGSTDDDAVIGFSSDGTDGTDYNFLGPPYSSFISNGITSASGSSVRCGTSDNLPMEGDEPDIFSVLSGSTVEPGLTDSWDAHFDSANEPMWSQGKLEFGVAVISWNDLNWITDQEFYPMPPNPDGADITVFLICEEDVSGQDVFSAWGLVDQLVCPPPTIPAPGAILLGTLGVGLVGWMRRRRTL